VKLAASSSLPEIAITVGDALRRHRIRAVLTGGACASVYCRGACVSAGADFVLAGEVSRQALDSAMAEVGFTRRGDRYVHPGLVVFVEFPRGPLAIGGDAGVRPIVRRAGHRSTLALSPTDSCRDRLAAYYHWNDRQCLRVAVEIALRHRVSLERIHRWSADEGSAAGFQRFLAALGRARRAERRAK
jgi:hypothetical protein